ncbi:hypothetical protein Halar_3128 [halophilic archaeon DL31]|jgi:hypothetical protein|nr:hypothetical protein Halar_3128 [halophilic archaeon DL31]
MRAEAYLKGYGGLLGVSFGIVIVTRYNMPYATLFVGFASVLIGIPSIVYIVRHDKADPENILKFGAVFLIVNYLLLIIGYGFVSTLRFEVPYPIRAIVTLLLATILSYVSIIRPSKMEVA